MSLKYNTKQRYKTIQGLRSFKNTLPTKVKRILDKKGRMYNETLDNWRYIVGDELFKVCYPKSFKTSNKLGGSYLIIMVKRGNEVDLEYSKKNIMNKMNAYFGYEAVKNIKLNTFEGEYEKNKDSREEIFNYAVKNKWSILKMTPKTTNLEDIFRNLTKFFI